MKEQILKLRADGYSYRQIEKMLGCARSTISFHCGNGQKEKNNNRVIKRKAGLLPSSIKISQSLSNFNQKIRSFTDNRFNNGDKITKEDVEDVLMQQQNRCYLTGEQIDFTSSSQIHFDHKIPASKGGSSTKENLGIVTKWANLAKSDMCPEEFLNVCKKVLEYNGYKVEKLYSPQK